MAINIRDEFKSIHDLCATTLNRSFETDVLPKMAKSFVFVSDLSAWTASITPQPECALFLRAEQEYMASLINVSQGQYRNAFKGLRLVLELSIQGTYLSANIVELHEWLRNAVDTNWATLMDPNKGPISKRYCDAFFPGLREHTDSFLTIARTVYRELSETIHGNTPKLIPHPSSFAFNQEAFDLWHEKAETVRIIAIFCFSVRYLKTLPETKRAPLEASILDQLGHIEVIRTLLGGPSTK